MNLPALASDQPDRQLLRQAHMRLAEKIEEVHSLTEQVASLTHQLAWFKQQVFGEKSEKRLIDNPDQLPLGDALKDPEPEAPVPTEQITYTRRKKPRDGDCVTDQGLRFNDSVPREVIELSAAELNGPDADRYEVIDVKSTYRLAQRPGSYVVMEYRRPVLRLKSEQTLITTPAPPGLFDRCIADVSLIAGMLVEKFVHHLPLYRQHQRMAMAGITVSRSLLTQYEQKAGQLLAPIAEENLKAILESNTLTMDETPVKCERKTKGKMKTGYFWTFYGDQDDMAFIFAPGRSGVVVEPRLKDYDGVLLTDGYGEYDRLCKKYPAITHAQCWTHSRRYFIRAEDAEPQAAKEALNLIAPLYKVEADIRKAELTGQEKLEYRQEYAKPLVDNVFQWNREQLRRLDLTKTNPLTKAIGYVGKREQQLRVYLDNPDVAIDTNHIERGLRCIPMGRRNWLFCWTESGAEHVATFQTLLVSCRLHGIDPYKYLVDVLLRISLHPARDVRDLIPRLWKDKFGANPLTSDLDR